MSDDTLQAESDGGLSFTPTSEPLLFLASVGLANGQVACVLHETLQSHSDGGLSSHQPDCSVSRECP